jgi:hypothetical protein
MDAMLATVTVVIPVGPGDTVAPELREQLRALPSQARIRVVCAREADAAVLRGSASTDPRSPWEVLTAPSGRASQQNAGAADACTAYLWFLHADSRLADDTLPALADFVGREEWALGYFDLRFLDDGPKWVRLNALGAWLRSRWLHLPFGDQGFVLPRVAFEDLAGFDPRLPSGEDHDLIWRARRADLPIRPLQASLYTSARKYAQRGWRRTTWQHVRATWQQARRFSRATEGA